jgi:hypothetical protein
MVMRIAFLLVITGVTFSAMDWLPVGPAAIFAGFTLGAFELDGRLNIRESEPTIPVLKELSRVDQSHRAA